VFVAAPTCPDTPEVRSDICDYYFRRAALRPATTGAMLRLLEKAGQLDNTIVIMTGDNGWPFPARQGDPCTTAGNPAAARRSLARRAVKGRRHVRCLPQLSQDFAPTLLEAAGLKPPATMTGRSFLDLLTGTSKLARDPRLPRSGSGTPTSDEATSAIPRGRCARASSCTSANFHPERWPAGDRRTWKAVGPFGDIDGGPRARTWCWAARTTRS